MTDVQVRPTGSRRRSAAHPRRWLMIGGMLALWVALGQPAVAQVLPPDTYKFWVHSQPGDPWGQVFHKSDWSYQANDGQFICLGYDWLHDGSLNHLTFFFNGNNG